jgi:hypothetical protein
MEELRDDIFNAWKNSLHAKYGTGIYAAKGRQEPIEDLVAELLEMGISYEVAKGLKNKIKTALVTKNGLSSSNKNYQGWKENAENDFSSALYDVYRSKNLITVTELIPEKQPNTSSNSEPLSVVSERHPLIEIWGQNKFREAWCDKLSEATNTPDSSLHNLFLDEFFC